MNELSDTGSIINGLRAREAAAEWVPRAQLKPWDRNPRQNAKAVKAVADSIKRFGFAAPILARRADGEVIAGHTRLLAAESLGLDLVPVRWMDLDPADAHLLALADNKLNEKADWDDAAVASILSDYSLDEAALAGFDAKDLDAIGEALGADDESDRLEQSFAVLVECETEADQLEVIERCQANGWRVKAMV